MTDSRTLRVHDAAEDLAATVSSVLDRIDVRRAPGVRGQLVRAAAAVAAPITPTPELSAEANVLQWLKRSLASATETGRHLRTLRRTGAIDPLAIARCEAKRTVVCKMLVGLIRRLEEQAEQERREKYRPRR